MKKTNFINLVLLIVLFISSSFVPKNKTTFEKNKMCGSLFWFNNQSTITIPYVSFSYDAVTYDHSNILAGGNSGNSGYYPSSTQSVEITIQFPPNNPSGRITIKEGFNIIRCINVPANTNQIFLLFVNNPGCSAFVVTFDNAPC